MIPKDRLDFSAIEDRPPLRLPDGVRMVVWPVIALEDWDVARPMACTVIRRSRAQTTNDFAAMEKLFGDDLTYNHSSAATDNKATYIESMRSGRTKYRAMTPNSDMKTRTHGCLAIITGTAVYEVTSGGQDRTVPLRFTAIGAKRPSGLEFVWWTVDGNSSEAVGHDSRGRLTCMKRVTSRVPLGVTESASALTGLRLDPAAVWR